MIFLFALVWKTRSWSLPKHFRYNCNTKDRIFRLSRKQSFLYSGIPGWDIDPKRSYPNGFLWSSSVPSGKGQDNTLKICLLVHWWSYHLTFYSFLKQKSSPKMWTSTSVRGVRTTVAASCVCFPLNRSKHALSVTDSAQLFYQNIQVRTSECYLQGDQCAKYCSLHTVL